MISNVKIYALEESIKASGYPTRTELNALDKLINIDNRRAVRLGSSEIGSGEDCFLKGIIVHYDLLATHTFWLQFMRYHFHDVISSQSKMYNLTNFDFDLNSPHIHEYVEPELLEVVYKMIKKYKEKTKLVEWKGNTYNRIQFFEKIVMNVPLGFKIGARIHSNYLQLKSIYYQRESHKLQEWNKYCNWIEDLPRFKELIITS